VLGNKIFNDENFGCYILSDAKTTAGFDVLKQDPYKYLIKYHYFI